MIVDASAIMAILNREPEAEEFALLIQEDAQPQMSAVGVVELALAAGRTRSDDVDDVLEGAGIDIVEFSARHAGIARHAFESTAGAQGVARG